MTELLTGAVDGPAMAAMGGWSLTVSVVVAGAETEPLLSVAVIEMVNTCDRALPVLAYACVADVGLPIRRSDVPSPHITVTDAMVPSGSVAVKVTVTVWRVRAGFGVGALTITVGGLSLIVSVVMPLPDPALLVAVTVIVNTRDIALPVDE